MEINVNNIKNRLLVKYPTFGSIIANTEIIETKGVPTAGTDAEKIYYNPDFIGTLSEDEQLFVFAHEVCHIALDHIYRSEGRDKKLWNIATDAVSNALLKADGLPIPEGGVNMPKAINYTAEEIYDTLVQNKNNQSGNNGNPNQDNSQNNGNNQSQSSSGFSNNKNQNVNNSTANGSDLKDNKEDLSDKENENHSSGGGEKQNKEKEEKNKDVGHDTHSLWEKAVEKKKQKKDKKVEGSITQNKEKSQKEEKASKGDKKGEEKEEKIKELSKLSEKEIFEKNKKERKKLMEKLKDKMARQASNTTNEDDRSVENIGEESKYIDWRLLLKEAIKYDIDWSYKNATIEDGVVTPHLEEESRPETEIVLDTSGSIDEDLLKGFLKECKNIIKTSKVKVGCFDTKFYGFKEIRTEKDIDNYKFKGGGGTNFDAAVKAFSRRVENKIIFTDGEASMPSLKIDAIWVVFGGTKINPKGGKVIYISDEQLDRIYSYKSKGTRNGR